MRVILPVERLCHCALPLLGQMSEIRELHAADRRRQAMTSEMLKADHRRSAEMRELRTADRTRQQQLIQTLTVMQSLQREVTPLLGQVVTAAFGKHVMQTGMADRMTAILQERDGAISHKQLPCGKSRFKSSTCTLRAEVTDKYVRGTRLNKLEATELWNLKVKGTDVIADNQRFQELALLCVRMFPEESNKIERAYTAGTGENKSYGGSKPLCAKCNYHHDGPCAPKCHKCNKVGHFSRDCRSAGNANNANNQRGTGSGQKPTCFKCGVQGHFKRECLKLKNNKNCGNQVGNDRAPAKVYVVGHAGTNPNSNIVMGTFLLNNRYASILFDTGADRSFVSTTFSSQMDITPSTLDHYYDVELADGRIIRLNTILRGCTLNLLNHPFNINLMPVELGSFDAIIGMVNWLQVLARSLCEC
ncbi:reverse transcriptase domain-containing protein [Tanacetum coccineum]